VPNTDILAYVLELWAVRRRPHSAGSDAEGMELELVVRVGREDENGSAKRKKSREGRGGNIVDCWG
jgi:hypothetical protein